MILRNERNEPPGGWRYTQEETGLKLMERTLPDLCRKIREHRTYKGLGRSLDLEVISVEVQRQICAGMNNSPVFCRPEIGFITQAPVDSEFEFVESVPVEVPEMFKPKVKVETEKKVTRKRHARAKQEQD